MARRYPSIRDDQDSKELLWVGLTQPEPAVFITLLAIMSLSFQLISIWSSFAARDDDTSQLGFMGQRREPSGSAAWNPDRDGSGIPRRQRILPVRSSRGPTVA